eukprot:2607690-Amphidinium_carterae.1
METGSSKSWISRKDWLQQARTCNAHTRAVPVVAKCEIMPKCVPRRCFGSRVKFVDRCLYILVSLVDPHRHHPFAIDDRKR